MTGTVVVSPGAVVSVPITPTAVHTVVLELPALTPAMPRMGATAALHAPMVAWGMAVSAATLAATAALRAPAVSADLAPLLPSGFAAGAAMRAPSVSVGAEVTPSPLTATAALLAPIAAGGWIVQPPPLAATAQFSAPTVAATVGVAPAALSASAAMRTPIVSTVLLVQPAPLAASTLLVAPAVSSGAAATSPTPFTATATVLAPSAASGAGTQPAPLTTTAQLRTPTVSVGYGATPTAMTATATLRVPVAGMGVNVTVPVRMTATAQGITPESIAATTTITGGGPFGATAQMLTPGVSLSGGTINLSPPVMSATAGALAPTVSLTAPTPWLNYVTINAPRNGTTTHTVDPSSGTVVSGTLFTPTAGRLLVCVVEGAVTSSTPTGWTLPTGGSAVNNTGLYVWHRTAAGADTLTTTHNGANYPVAFAFFEFASGSAFLASAASSSGNMTAANPNLTGLSASAKLLMGTLAVGTNGTGAGGAVAWSGVTGITEILDTVFPASGTDGFLISIAYVPNSTATSFQPTGTVTSPAGGAFNKEALTFAISVT